MDSMTIIAVASIVIAGITTGFGSMGPALAEGQGGRDGAEFAGAAARRLRHHHPDPVRRSGDDRVHGHLLLRGLDDSHFRQSVLESRHRPNRGKVIHAHRLVHRRCASAQLLILVWLLKRFLYKPILDAIDAREKRIAAELADADAKKAEAQKERDEFQHKNEEFDQQRAALLSKATDEAKAERQRLLDEARQAADALSAKRQETLRNDAHNLNQAIARRTRAGSVCHRAKGADGSRHDEPGRTHGRGVHAPLARDGRQGEGRVSPRPSRQRLPPRSCAARLTCLRSSAQRYKMRSTKPSRLISRSGSRPRRTWSAGSSSPRMDKKWPGASRIIWRRWKEASANF